MSLSPRPVGLVVREHLGDAATDNYILPRAIPYSVRKYISDHPHLKLLKPTMSHLNVLGDRVCVANIKGVYVALWPDRYVLIFSRYNAIVHVETPGTPLEPASHTHRVLLSNESMVTPNGLGTGSRPCRIKVYLKHSCWPVFKDMEKARRFCPTKWPLKCLKIGCKSLLFYGEWNNQIVCIECHRRFSHRTQIIEHVGLPLPT